ncbi:DUF418 domain-containing protein [Bacillus zhangzhouensis]|nr:DUF418 domain-containing protein [Bacillus zhangzhouensis]
MRTTIFYCYGLGIWTDGGNVWATTAQLFISYVYLKKWRRGPVEWLMGKWSIGNKEFC